MKYFLTLIISILYLAPVSADTTVGGFFPENFVREGSFKDRPGFETPIKENGFFISREERELHPERAPSNNIRIPKRFVRVSNIPVITRGGNIRNIWNVGVVSH